MQLRSAGLGGTAINKETGKRQGISIDPKILKKMQAGTKLVNNPNANPGYVYNSKNESFWFFAYEIN